MTLDGESLAAIRRIVATVSGGYRLEILMQLLSGPKGVSGLAHAIGVSLSTVSQNLRELRNLGLVEFRRNGRHCLYRLPQGFGWDVSADTAELGIDISPKHRLSIRIEVLPDTAPDGLVKVVPRSQKPPVP